MGTATSHFARKVRIVFHELGIAYDYQLVPDLFDPDAAAYGHNPLLQIPTLIDGDLRIIDSDHIVRHVVATRAPDDPLRILALSVAELNQLAVLNGIMAHQATVMLAQLGGLTDWMANAYFRKLAHGVMNGLEWLDQQLDCRQDSFTYIDIATICMWQHLWHFGTFPEVPACRRIAQRVESLAARESIVSTRPGAR